MEYAQRIYRKLLADELHWLMEAPKAAEPLQERNRTTKSKGDTLSGQRHPALTITAATGSRKHYPSSKYNLRIWISLNSANSLQHETRQS